MGYEASVSLVRHATTDLNRVRAYTAPISTLPDGLSIDREATLSPESIGEIATLANNLAVELADVPANSIIFYSSDWKRARQTAESTHSLINQTRSQAEQIGAIVYDTRLGEQQFGMTDPALAKKDPRLARRRRNYLRATRRDTLQRITRRPIHRLSREIRSVMEEYGFGESMRGTSLVDVSNALSRWLADIEPNLVPGTHVIAFTHGGAIMASRMSFLGEATTELAEFISSSENHPHACSVTTYSREADGWKLSAWAKIE